jgi:hypothetical protein
MTRAGWLQGGAALVLGVVALGAVGASATPCKGCTGPPMIENVKAGRPSDHSALLSAAITPEGLTTRWEAWVEYGVCQGGAGECPKPPKKQKLASGKIVAEQLVKVTLSKLTPGCSYSYWFAATNADGTVTSEPQTVTAKGGTPGPKECSR